MRAIRTALKFRVELAGHKEWMVDALNNFYQIVLWVYAAGFNAPFSKFTAEGVVTFAAMSVAFSNIGCFV